jgi:hypothetical protein
MALSEYDMRQIRIQILQCRTLELTAELTSLEVYSLRYKQDIVGVGVVRAKLEALLKELNYLTNQ